MPLAEEARAGRAQRTAGAWATHADDQATVVQDYHRRVQRLFKVSQNAAEGASGSGDGPETPMSAAAKYREAETGRDAARRDNRGGITQGQAAAILADVPRTSVESITSDTTDASGFGEDRDNDEPSGCLGSCSAIGREVLEDPQVVRRHLTKALERGRFGAALDITCTLAAVVGVALYCVECYNETSDRSLVFFTADLACAAVLVFELACYVLVAENRIAYALSLQGTVSILATFPSLLEAFVMCAKGDCTAQPSEGSAAYVLHALRVFRLLRLYFLRKRIKGSDAEVQQALYSLCFTTLTSIFVTAALLHALEYDSCWAAEFGDSCLRMEFHDALYLSVITVSTVGYGDLYPQSTGGKIVIVAAIAFTFVTVPALSNHLIGLLSAKSLYARVRYRSTKAGKHVVVTGSISASGLSTFLDEFYHPDHGNQNSKVVILHPHSPNSQILALLKSSQYAGQLHYIEGSAVKDADIRRAAAQSAQACFVLSNQFCADKDEDDASNSLKALAVKHLTSRMRVDGSQVSMIVQLHRSVNKQNLSMCFRRSDFARSSQTDQILCLDELKLNLLGMTCICPGVNTLVSNLISSRDDTPPDDCENKEWQEEYCHGCGFEIYCDKLGKSFHGMKVQEAAKIIKQRFETVLFAVEMTSESGDPTVVLAPLQQRITKDTLAYFISEDSDVIKRISTYSEVIARGMRNSRKRLLVEADRPAESDESKEDVIATAERLFEEESRNVSDGAVNALLNSPRNFEAATTNMGLTPRSASEANDNASAKANDASGNGTGTPRLKKYVRRSSMILRSMNDRKVMRQHLTDVEAIYHTQEPVALADAIVSGVDASVEDHIVICGTPAMLYSLIHFIAPLRRRTIPRDKLQPVVVLTPAPPSEASWARVSRFVDIRIVVGSCQDSKVLVSVGVERAHSAVVIATSQVASASTEDAEVVVDTDSIFAFQNMKRIAADLNVVVEIIDSTNMAFMIPSLHWQSAENFMAPPFAAGFVYTSAMLDTMVCQSYYNPNLFSILRTLLGGSSESLLCFPPASEDSKPQVVHQGYLEQIDLSSDPALRRLSTYGDLFDYLLFRRNRLAIGLYRDEGKESDLPYVYTNPSRGVSIAANDSVFVLVHIPVSAAAVDRIVREVGKNKVGAPLPS